jgi:hypothetical protein
MLAVASARAFDYVSRPFRKSRMTPAQPLVTYAMTIRTEGERAATRSPSAAPPDGAAQQAGRATAEERGAELTDDVPEARVARGSSARLA